MSSRTKIAAVQMISGPEVGANLVEAARLIGQAAAEGAQLVALPEYFPMIGASDEARLEAREQEGDGPIQRFLSETAKRHGIWLVGGSLPFAADDPAKQRNTCLVYDETGRQVLRYDKIHLFGFARGTERYDEGLTIEPGSEVAVIDSPFGGMGLAICYDLRFPELFRAMGAVDLLVLPAAFTETTGLAHWELLLRARAVENQCYLLAAAQGGRHPNGRMTHGNSMIVDPWGEVLARLDKGPGVCVANIDPARIMDVRASLPALKHRKL
ncbi:2-oxoglutaramate amidase [mine drainage metagenome]|uniref:2-oxoglutaramate amidase n=1 Tax=mine drainage metagenome TaxID=410659 RepID=A0A1J5RLD7_9ZZZZ